MDHSVSFAFETLCFSVSMLVYLRIGCKRAVQNITEIHLNIKFILQIVVGFLSWTCASVPRDPWLCFSHLFFWVKSSEFVWKSNPPKKKVRSSSLSPLFHHFLSLETRLLGTPGACAPCCGFELGMRKTHAAVAATVQQPIPQPRDPRWWKSQQKNREFIGVSKRFGWNYTD